MGFPALSEGPGTFILRVEKYRTARRRADSLEHTTTRVDAKPISKKNYPGWASQVWRNGAALPFSV
jgi:hypothetical protein